MSDRRMTSILISVDIEGVACVLHPDQTRMGKPGYEQACLWMTAEANAAVEAALEAGVASVYVNDSHGSYRNMNPCGLDERVQIIQGKPRAMGMMAGLEQGVDAVCMIGYHARAGSGGILAHTINSFAFAEIRVNGDPMGEAGLYGALAAFHGASVIMAAGDDVFVKETRPLFPGARFVETKRATGFQSGICLSPARSCQAIHEGVKLAIADWAAQASATGSGPFEGALSVEVETTTPALADLFCLWPGLERKRAKLIGFDAQDIEHALRILNALSAMSAMLRA